MQGRRFKLLRGPQLLGSVTCTADDDPWFSGTFEPTSAFSEVEPLFAAELAFLQAEDLERWDSAYAAAVGPGLRLEPDDAGPSVPEPILHFHEHEVRWRF